MNKLIYCAVAILAASTAGPLNAATFITGGENIGSGTNIILNLLGTLREATSNPDADKEVGTLVPATTLRQLRVSVYFFEPLHPNNAVSIAVRLNGVDSSLACTATGPGKTASCKAAGPLAVPNNSRLSIHATGRGPNNGAIANWSIMTE